MQDTRRHILNILKERGHATVEEIVDLLKNNFGQAITAVTVRHHLNILQQDGLITEPELRHRSTPGRPQHIYALSDKALDHFPNNYKNLLSMLIMQLKHQLPANGVNVIFEGVANHMASQIKIDDINVEAKMDAVVEYLNQNGYNASWESSKDGIILLTRNCPYHHISERDDTLCHMDMHLISTLVGAVPRKMSSMAHGDGTCSYLIPVSESAN